MNTQDILIRAIITEKSLEDAKSRSEFTFEVGKSATKPQIKKAVGEIFGVKVLAVRTVKISGENKRFGFRNFRQTPDVKKAIVKLAEGQKIELFEVKEKK